MPISMMSISPLEGQTPVVPSIQKAGQRPFSRLGTLIRASSVPYLNCTRPNDLRRAEVKDLPWKFSRRASMRRLPFSMRAFSGRLV